MCRLRYMREEVPLRRGEVQCGGLEATRVREDTVDVRALPEQQDLGAALRAATLADTLADTYRQDLELVAALRASEASFLAAHADAGDADADADAEALAAEDRALPCYVLPSTGGDSSSQLAQTSWALRHGYATEC